MDEREEFQELLRALRAGYPGAADEFYRRFGAHLRTVVRRKLHHRLRTRYDSLDFVQDVWASFLTLPAGQDTFPSSQTLLAFLVRVAHNKIIDAFRHRFQTQKDNIAREHQPDEEVAEEPQALTPSPSQSAEAEETWQRLLNHVPPGHRSIVERLREGYTYEEIARMTNVSVSTINRIVRRLRDASGL